LLTRFAQALRISSGAISSVSATISAWLFPGSSPSASSFFFLRPRDLFE
jgi:hypothetical protein